MKKLNILLIGYGKMGREIEKIALKQSHHIIGMIDQKSDWEKYTQIIDITDVAIDFSIPDEAINNISKCRELNLPLVIGTTGWHHELEQVKEETIKFKSSLLWASNFSLGVNILFHFNKKLAEVMSQFSDYNVSIHEIHHDQKLDAPSGTAISLANDILKANAPLKNWYLKEKEEAKNAELPITYERIGKVPGTHEITYSSKIDEITLKHEAKNRQGFAKGAVLAAEWLVGKKGFFEMKDVLGF